MSKLLFSRSPQGQMSKCIRRGIVTTLRLLLRSRKVLKRTDVFTQRYSIKELFWKFIGKNLWRSTFLRLQLYWKNFHRNCPFWLLPNFSEQIFSKTLVKPHKSKTDWKRSYPAWKIMESIFTLPFVLPYLFCRCFITKLRCHYKVIYWSIAFN